MILVAPHDYGQVRQTIEHLRAQTALQGMEVIVVALSPAEFRLPGQMEKEFENLSVVEAATVVRRGAAAAVGVKHSRAPVIAFVEEHSFPAPRWAESLINGHRQPYDVVGPVVINENPATLLSTASFMIAYGTATENATGGEVEHLPWHNSSYDRALLTEYGDKLGDLLEWEGALQEDVRDRGYRLCLEPAARTYHMNTSRLAPFVAINFVHGRLFGDHRSRKGEWSLARRLLYIAGSPLFPLIRLWNLIPHVLQLQPPPPRVLGALPLIMLGFAAHAAGEATAYALGPGNAVDHLQKYELYRRRYVSRKDRVRQSGGTLEPF